ncbi:cupin domain-containing protein [Croceiramulus getboli]|nr:cupin domain-containing protein [Flavobacteriaceae bacterium YJPT1-3]
MNRKSFLKQLGAAAVFTAVPTGTVLAALKNQGVRSLLPAGQSDPRTLPKVVRKEEGKALVILGNKQWHKITGADTENQFFEWFDRLSPGSMIPPHIHSREDEIFRVKKGEVEFMIGDRITTLQAGDVAFAPKNIAHSWKVVGQEEAEMTVSVFPAGMEHMFHELHQLPPGPPDLERVSAICETYGIQFV